MAAEIGKASRHKRCHDVPSIDVTTVPAKRCKQIPEKTQVLLDRNYCKQVAVWELLDHNYCGKFSGSQNRN